MFRVQSLDLKFQSLELKDILMQRAHEGMTRRPAGSVSTESSHQLPDTTWHAL